MRNPEREKKTKLEERTRLVKAALEVGHIERAEICKAAGISLYDLGNLFRDNKELAAEYRVRKRTLLDMATDNVHAIVADRAHPQNYQASKYIIDKFKSEFDDNFESKDSEVIQVDVNPSEDSRSPVSITFTSS